jgi:uncharacterized protein YceK
MFSPRRLFGFAIALTCLGSGCGTVVNLAAPPEQPFPTIAPGTCFPFGGVTRSGLLGGFGVVTGMEMAFGFEGIAETGVGLLWTGGGLVALAVDTPLSLVGDVVTLPVAYARSQKMSWATWWGEQSTSRPLFLQKEESSSDGAAAGVSHELVGPPAPEQASGGELTPVEPTPGAGHRK